MPKSKEILNTLLKDIKTASAGQEPVRVVFDLDSTLFNVAPRFAKVIQDFCADLEMRKKYPGAIAKLESVVVTTHPYYLKEFMNQIGLTDETKEFYKDVFEFWKVRFFTDEYLMFDEPEIGAVDFVTEIYDMGVHVIYLTARDEPRMKKGSIESLKKWHFPLEPNRADLVLKPEHITDDAAFKRDHFMIFPPTEKIWFFENEPVNIHLVLKDLPHVKVVYFDSVHSGKAPAPEGLLTITHFQAR